MFLLCLLAAHVQTPIWIARSILFASGRSMPMWGIHPLTTFCVSFGSALYLTALTILLYTYIRMGFLDRALTQEVQKLLDNIRQLLTIATSAMVVTTCAPCVTVFLPSFTVQVACSIVYCGLHTRRVYSHTQNTRTPTHTHVRTQGLRYTCLLCLRWSDCTGNDSLPCFSR